MRRWISKQLIYKTVFRLILGCFKCCRWKLASLTVYLDNIRSNEETLTGKENGSIHKLLSYHLFQSKQLWSMINVMGRIMINNCLLIKSSLIKMLLKMLLIVWIKRLQAWLCVNFLHLLKPVSEAQDNKVPQWFRET